MIRVFLGNVGSGKTISAVKELVEKENNKHATVTFSNIITKQKGKYKLTKNKLINRDMLILKEVVRQKKDGTTEYKLKFNAEFWKSLKKQYKAFDVTIDEAHTLMNSRSAMSKQNKVMNDFLSLIRKICSDPNHDSCLTLISQLDNRIDINARELATEVRYHLGMYEKVCSKCSAFWTEHTELSDFQKKKICPICNHWSIKKINNRLIVHYFKNIKDYQMWKYNGINTIITTKQISNINKYFPYYDTFQLTDLISEDD